ncbi:MAG TPA: MarR family transcriptional regulator [Pedobacter sp.]|jgi:DNA-binding MarR family transcriptional regulator
MIKTKAELARELMRSMAELKNHLRQYIQVKIKEYNINITFEMLEVMSCLWKKDGINQQEIADKTLKDKSSMTYLIDNLVKRDMVTRTEDEADRRNKLIYLTAEGKRLQEQLNPWIAEVYGIATIDLDIGDLKNGLRAVNRMTDNLKE